MPNQTQFACHECDLLMEITPLDEGQEASCPRCGHHVLVRKIDSLNRTIALAFAGLVIFLPAVGLPLMSISAAGMTSSASLIEGIQSLWQSDLLLVAFSVLFFCVLAPLTKLLIAGYICLSVKYKGRHKRRYQKCLKLYLFMDSWEMLEVFMIGILVSIIKLKDMAELSLDVGLICFLLLMLIVVAIKVTLDKNLLWKAIDVRA